jgi:hypothetical protein
MSGEAHMWLSYVRLVKGMRNGVMASTSLHLTISSNRHVGITECGKSESIIFEQSPMAYCPYKI